MPLRLSEQWHGHALVLQNHGCLFLSPGSLLWMANVRQGCKIFLSFLLPERFEDEVVGSMVGSAIRDMKLRRRFQCITKQDLLNLVGTYCTT